MEQSDCYGANICVGKSITDILPRDLHTCAHDLSPRLVTKNETEAVLFDVRADGEETVLTFKTDGALCKVLAEEVEKLPHYYFSWIASVQKQRQMRDASSGDKTIRS
jgi:hypothetical protein